MTDDLATGLEQAILAQAEYLDRERDQAEEEKSEHEAFSRMWDFYNGRAGGLQMAMMELERLIVGRPSDHHDKALPAIKAALVRAKEQEQSDE